MGPPARARGSAAQRFSIWCTRRSCSSCQRQLNLWAADPVVESTLSAVHADDGPQLGATAERLGVSHRTLVNRFRRVVGTTPRDYAQVWRFHRFVVTLQRQSLPPAWATLAPEVGYYDQPHVIRAFRRFSGWTPTEYLRRLEAFGPDAAGFVPLDEVPSSNHSALS